MKKLLRFLLTTPQTPEAQWIAMLIAILTLLLWTPDIFANVQMYLEPFLISRWGSDFYIPVNIAVWALLFPAMFYMLKSSIQSSVGMAVMYLANLVNPIF